MENRKAAERKHTLFVKELTRPHRLIITEWEPKVQLDKHRRYALLCDRDKGNSPMDKDVETPEPLDYHLWELYLVGCNERDVTPSLSDFQLWLAEQGYNDSDEVEP